MKKVCRCGQAYAEVMDYARCMESHKKVAATVANRQQVANKADNRMVAKSPSNKDSKHGKYKDTAKRREYMRKYMAGRRAGE